MKRNEKMEGELNLKCLFFNYKCSSSKQLFLTAGHQLRRVTEVFRQEINKWDFFLGQEKPLHNGCVSSLCLPSFQELAGVQDSEAILRQGAQHQAQQQQHAGLQCLEPGRASREGQYGTGQISPPTLGRAQSWMWLLEDVC